MVATVDRGEAGALVLLDMSAVFDTIDHRKMLDELQQRFDVQDAVLDLFASYFTVQTQDVVIGDDSSIVSEMRIGAPHGSVYGPRSFVAYVEDVTEIFHHHIVHHHMVADDMQGTRHNEPSKAHEVTVGFGACMTAGNDWCV